MIFVPEAAMLDALSDGMLTIGEIAELPGLVKGSAERADSDPMRAGARMAALLLVLAGVPGVPAPSSGQVPDLLRTLYGDTAVVGEGVIRTWSG